MTEPETQPVSEAEETSTETAPIIAATAPAAKPKGYAIIETGGKQYRVSVGDRITVERLASDAGGAITIDRVLMVANDGGTQIGTPVVAGASVVATVDDHFRGEKLIVFKYKPKKRYRRKIGHRQELSHLTITAINA